MSLQDLQNATHNFDPTFSHEDFLDQMLCGLQSGVSWPDGDVDQPTFLTTKLRQHQISGGAGGIPSSSGAAKSLLLQQQLLLSDTSPFKSLTGDNSIQDLFNGFTGSRQSNQAENFQYPPSQSFGSPVPASINQRPITAGATDAGGGGSGLPAQPRQKVRARRGQATDPHSIAERLRRERIAERMKSLQELVPNANKTDKASMLDEIIDYVKFLQLQVKVLSMSRLGGAVAVAPLVADISSEGVRDGVEVAAGGMSGSGTPPESNNETMTVAENKVVKLMEEDMGSAMQYLQGKGLCLMPISLATAISTATTTHHLSSAMHNHPSVGGSPSPPNLPVLNPQSANGALLHDVVSVKQSTTGSKS